MIWLYHNTRDEKFRKPFGAVKKGSTVTLVLAAYEEKPEKVLVRTWVDGRGEAFFPMNEVESPDEGWRYQAELPAETADLCWYWFLAVGADNTEYRYGARDGRVGGEGQMSYGEPASFQITMYEERKVPAWYKDGIAYQIFPDRFNRGEDWKERVEASFAAHKNGPERRLVEDWYKLPVYEKDEKGDITAWEFYGGTLSGIIEKLDYIKELGATILYLNPIFEAASNHRYDTGDYEKIDPMLGDEETFTKLCRAAEEKGIHVILDGVFNHTGCDSKYFDRYGNYGGQGAYANEDSPYRKWFHFDASLPAGYSGWWGVADLPDLEENEPSYREMIYEGKDSVVRKWLRAGAKGWRLDVADELPDDFIAGIKKAMVEELGDEAFLLGEVWEDASNKIAYSKLRRYLLGEELDSAMNYPLRDGIISFAKGTASAAQLYETCMSLLENYPPENFMAAFNLLSSHDRARLLTLLSDAPAAESLTEEQRCAFRLSEEGVNATLGKLWLAVFTQMMMPGVPVIYYGDEAGMQGYTDPSNRASFPWGRENANAQTIFRNAISLRKGHPIYSKGDFYPMHFGDDVFCIRRRYEGDEAYILINHNPNRGYEITLPATTDYPVEILSGTLLNAQNGEVKVSLHPFGTAVVFNKKAESLGCEFKRSSGILCHITSLPSDKGPGTIGQEAYRFVDFLAENHQKYWQILPLSPTDYANSPYAGMSAFSCNRKLLEESDEELAQAFEQEKHQPEFKAFVEQEKKWLVEYAMYCALQEKFHYIAWPDWEEKYRSYSEELWKDEALSERAGYFAYVQYAFDKKWRALRAYANSKGVAIIGDISMFVSGDSADVWAHPELFRLDAQGRMAEEAGAAPDYFTQKGQAWGNPTYIWDAHKKQDYEWWIRRFERAMYLYDFTRIDHFRGFDMNYCIAKGQTAEHGSWRFGPGYELYRKLYDKHGALPFIVEDLGDITPSVRQLVFRCGFPGTDVIEFYDRDPMQYVCDRNKAAYSGTHDNETLIEWCHSHYPNDPNAANTLLQRLYQSDANLVIIPLQDAIGLGEGNRMNMPGTCENNWSWQAKGEQMELAAERLARLVAISNRE